MHVITARNVNDAWAKAHTLLAQHGVREQSRNGPVTVVPTPVATVYDRPYERVLLDGARDCNPFLHLFEALWMLDGRDDAVFLDQFVGDFSARYAEPDGRLHGAYGDRWRNHFELHESFRDESVFGICDQLAACVQLLRADPESRQAVIQMWDPVVDLGVPGLKDRPCNQSVMLRVRDANGGVAHSDGVRKVLDVTVTCRSNDVVWGCYGANAVHFGVLHEYLAAMIGVDVGTYVQFSNNWHCYDAALHLVDTLSAEHNAMRPYPGMLPLVDRAESFDEELRDFLDDPTGPGEYDNSFFHTTARPMWLCNAARRAKDFDGALAHARTVAAPDWRAAAVEWLERRAVKRGLKSA